jgi:hypothetical protein
MENIKAIIVALLLISLLMDWSIFPTPILKVKEKNNKACSY